MKFTLALLIFFISCSIFSQAEVELKKTFHKYENYIEAKDFDKAFDYYNSKILKYIPKEKFITEVQSMTSIGNTTSSVKNHNLLSISEIINYDSTNYAVLVYGRETHLRFNKGTSLSSKKKLKNYFKEKYRENYSYSKNTIILYKEYKLVCEQLITWSFIPYKEKLKPYLHLWIPEFVIEKLL